MSYPNSCNSLKFGRFALLPLLWSSKNDMIAVVCSLGTQSVISPAWQVGGEICLRMDLHDLVAFCTAAITSAPPPGSMASTLTSSRRHLRAVHVNIFSAELIIADKLEAIPYFSDPCSPISFATRYVYLPQFNRNLCFELPLTLV